MQGHDPARERAPGEHALHEGGGNGRRQPVGEHLAAVVPQVHAARGHDPRRLADRPDRPGEHPGRAHEPLRRARRVPDVAVHPRHGDDAGVDGHVQPDPLQHVVGVLQADAAGGEERLHPLVVREAGPVAPLQHDVVEHAAGEPAPRDAPARHRVAQDELAPGHEAVQLLAPAPQPAAQQDGALYAIRVEVGHHPGGAARGHRDHNEVVVGARAVMNVVAVVGRYALRVAPAVEDLDVERVDPRPRAAPAHQVLDVVSGPLEQVSVRRADDPQADDEDVQRRFGAPVACRDCHAPRLGPRGFRAASRRLRPAPARGAQALRSSTRLMWWSASLCSTRVARPRVGAMFSRRLTRLTLSHTPFAAATAMSSGMAA